MVPLDDAYLDHFAEAVVQQIWVEMGRQRITSLRELARRAGMTHTSINVRLNGDSRTGKKVPINTRDLAALGDALGVDPSELLSRAALLAHELRAQAETQQQVHDIFDGPKARRTRSSVVPPTVTEEDLIGEPSVAQPDPTNDVEGDEEPEGP